MKSIKILFLSSIFLMGSQGLARSQSDADMYQATSTAISPTTTTLPKKETIQTIGMQAANNSNRGKNLANAAIAVTTAGVMATCWTGSSACKMFVAGLVASTVVRMSMGKSTGQSQGTVEAVTTESDPYNLGKGPNPEKTNRKDYEGEPDYNNAIQAINKLKKDGWKVDLASGTITPPKGKPFSTGIVNSPASMAAAGASPADIQAFQSAMAKVPAIAAEKSKAVDSSESMFADDGAGGGGRPAAGAAGVGEGVANFGHLNQGKSGDQLAIDRNPAQVAGMSKNYNGTPVGVSADSLFDMIVRRYQLHDKKGSFISGGN